MIALGFNKKLWILTNQNGKGDQLNENAWIFLSLHETKEMIPTCAFRVFMGQNGVSLNPTSKKWLKKTSKNYIVTI